jgi:hypothetical protein
MQSFWDPTLSTILERYSISESCPHHSAQVESGSGINGEQKLVAHRLTAAVVGQLECVETGGRCGQPLDIAAAHMRKQRRAAINLGNCKRRCQMPKAPERCSARAGYKAQNLAAVIRGECAKHTPEEPDARGGGRVASVLCMRAQVVGVDAHRGDTPCEELVDF